MDYYAIRTAFAEVMSDCIDPDMMEEILTAVDAECKPKKYDWVIHDMAQPDSYNPAFGPMTEDDMLEMMAVRDDRDYWAQNISKPVTALQRLNRDVREVKGQIARAVDHINPDAPGYLNIRVGVELERTVTELTDRLNALRDIEDEDVLQKIADDLMVQINIILNDILRCDPDKKVP